MNLEYDFHQLNIDSVSSVLVLLSCCRALVHSLKVLKIAYCRSLVLVVIFKERSILKHAPVLDLYTVWRLALMMDRKKFFEARM